MTYEQSSTSVTNNYRIIHLFITLTINKDTMKAEARRGYLAVFGILGSVFMVTGFTSVAVAFCSY